jgi:hypothetical protein
MPTTRKKEARNPKGIFPFPMEMIHCCVGFFGMFVATAGHTSGQYV